MDLTKEHDAEGSPRPNSDPAHRKQHRKILGQTTAAWYIYWICAVASIANMYVLCLYGKVLPTDLIFRFQGFDSGIYSIIISDPRFIKYFSVQGARSGVVASMGTFQFLPNSTTATNNISQSRKCHRKPLRSMVVYLVPWSLPCICLGDRNPPGRRGFAGWGNSLRDDCCRKNNCGYWYSHVGISLILYQSLLIFCSIGTNLAAYQAEVSSPVIRGRVVSFVQLSYQVGVLVSYCVGLGTVKIPGENSWRVATALQVIPGVILSIASFTIPESPRWMLERHPERPELVLNKLAQIRRLPKDDPEVQDEYLDLIAAHEYRVEHEGNFTWKKFLSTYANVVHKRVVTTSEPSFFSWHRTKLGNII